MKPLHSPFSNPNQTGLTQRNYLAPANLLQTRAYLPVAGTLLGGYHGFSSTSPRYPITESAPAFLCLMQSLRFNPSPQIES